MPKIHQLPPHIVAKIAAGEVIERPAYAIKELIENAIDAQATEITIYIEEAGLKKIQVTDNGEGMSEEDLKESWKPHTTSKITEEDTLIGIKSFGFRGEALASLAAVSMLSIRSRTKTSPTGTEITIAHSQLLHTRPVGMPEGTVVIAEQLFAAIPARKKFLKSPQTELRHSIDMVTHFAAVYPSIHFRFIHNKRILLDTPTTTEQKERLQLLLGENFSLFLPVRKDESYVKISGFIAKPQLTSTTQSKQFLFVNKRKVSDKLLSLAVKEAFGTMLEPTSYPLFVLFLEIPYDLVDINVHPRKEQVSFVNNQFIFQVVKEKITEVLQENNITFQNLSWKRNGVGTTNSYAATVLRESVLEKEMLQFNEETQILQLNKLYLFIPTRNGFFLVDQHAAHERILFEKLRKGFLKQKHKHKIYQLPKPVVLALSKSDVILLKAHLFTLTSLGFLFQKHTTTLTHIPLLLKDRNPEKLLQEILDDLSAEKQVKNIDTVSEEMMAFLACRAAVKAGDTLTGQHMKEILEKLDSTPNNATCPHGRPTRIFIPQKEIDTLFKR